MCYKVITGSIAHETNTFSTVFSDLEKFRDYGLHDGEQIFQVLTGTKTIGGGFIDIARERGFDLIGTRWNTPFACGTVTDAALNYLLTGVLEGIETADQVDGVLLQLHGAMVSESEPDVEGYVLQEVRKKVGQDIPIIGTLDLHGNLAPRIVEQADILVGYDTYPHVDFYERGIEAAELMDQMLKGEINPTAACEIPPMMPSPQKQKTSYYPAKEIIDLAHKI